MPRKSKKNEAKKKSTKQKQYQKQSINLVYPRNNTPSAFGGVSASRPYSSSVTSVVNVSAPLPQTTGGYPAVQQNPINIFDLVGIANRQLALEKQQKNLESHVKSAMLSADETSRILGSMKGSTSPSGPSGGGGGGGSFSFPDVTMQTAPDHTQNIKDEDMESIARSHGFRSAYELGEYLSGNTLPAGYTVNPIHSSTINVASSSHGPPVAVPALTYHTAGSSSQAHTSHPLSLQSLASHAPLPPGSVSSGSSGEASTNFNR